ncbi:MAG: DNA glycosylase [Filifactor alocis]|nr:DNA glycosylase [Filifactor alocis]
MKQRLKWKKISEMEYVLETDYLSLKQIYESGQAFRWIKLSDDDYIAIHEDRWIRVGQQGSFLRFTNASRRELTKVWTPYFDLDRDYSVIRKYYRGLDGYLDEAMDHGEGIRILKQSLLEIIITFIISANNHIPRIKTAIDKISRFAGSKIGEVSGQEIIAFPTLEALMEISDEQWKEVKLGYREAYIRKSLKMIKNKEVDLAKIKKLSTLEAKKQLMKLSGVGDKVADCILLYGMGRMDTFPVDVWMKRVMNCHYDIGEEESVQSIRQRGMDVFGETAGIAQQYLFYYERTKGR